MGRDGHVSLLVLDRVVMLRVVVVELIDMLSLRSG